MDNQVDVSSCFDLKKELPVERRVQLECVLRILEHFMKVLRISLSLPYRAWTDSVRFEEEDSVDSRKGFWFETIGEYCERARTSLRRKELVIKMMDFVDDHLDYCLSVSWTNYAPSLSTEDESLLVLFTQLCKISEERLSKSALADLSKEKKLQKLHRKLVDAEKCVAEYAEKLRKQRVKRLWELAYKGGLIHKYEEDLAVQKWDNNLRIKKEIVRSSKNILSLQEISSRILDELGEVVAQKRTAYNRLLRENLLLEREARVEKKKLLFQLQTYIRKYDQNVGEKIQEKLKLQETYEEEKRQFDEFMIEYQREEEEYSLMLLQKQKEDEEIFEQKLMVFMMGRAARVIQVNWRRFRRDQKKKSKRGKGKGKRK